MGGEFAQEREWNHDTGLDWHLLDDPLHARHAAARARPQPRLSRRRRRCTRAIARRDGFRWVVMDDRDQSVFAFLRLGGAEDAPALIVCNFTPVPRQGYRVGVPRGGEWREIVNTDAAIYGGSNLGNGGEVRAEETESHGQPASRTADLAASRHHRIARRIDDHSNLHYPLPFGAELQERRHGRDSGFWAPGATNVALEIEGQTACRCRARKDGWVSARAGAAAGARYRYRVKDGLAVPDPASRLPERGRARCERGG